MRNDIKSNEHKSKDLDKIIFKMLVQIHHTKMDVTHNIQGMYQLVNLSSKQVKQIPT